MVSWILAGVVAIGGIALFNLKPTDRKKRRVFYSFHFESDSWRTSQIRNIGVVEGNGVAFDNEWEKIKSEKDKVIKGWIDKQMKNRSCTIVLIGEKTSESKWVVYEIKKSLELGKGIFGIYIHRLKDSKSKRAKKGKNPFKDKVLIKEFGNERMNSIKTHNPPVSKDKEAYNYIADNLQGWIEESLKTEK